VLLAGALSLPAPVRAQGEAHRALRVEQTGLSPAAPAIVADATRGHIERAAECPVYILAAASPDLGLIRDAHGVEHAVHPGESLGCYGRIQRIEMEGMSWTVHAEHGTIR